MPSSRRQACASSALTAASKPRLPQEHVVEHREPLGPAWGPGQPLVPLARHRAEHIRPGHVDVRELTGRPAEQRTRAERREPELHTRLPATMCDHGRRGVQAADERRELARRLPWIRVRGYGERLVQGDDEGQPG